MYYSYCSCPVGIVQISVVAVALKRIDFVKDSDYNKQSNHITESVKIQIDQYFAGTRMAFYIEIEFRGTDLQKKVWRALKDIPYGHTASYKELAENINCSKGFRAVGNANNKNRYAIVVPCHRVIGSNGNLVGYAGGLDAEWAHTCRPACRADRNPGFAHWARTSASLVHDG